MTNGAIKEVIRIEHRKNERPVRGAKQFEVHGDHFACADTQTDFVSELVAACDHVHAAAA